MGAATDQKQHISGRHAALKLAVETLMIQNVVGILGNLLNSLKLLEIFDIDHINNKSADFHSEKCYRTWSFPLKCIVETLMMQNVRGV